MATRLRECRDCGLFQKVPLLGPGHVASCLRCEAVLRRGRHDPFNIPLALNLSGLVLLGVACSMSVLQVRSAGMARTVDLISGAASLDQYRMWELAFVVLFTTVVAPLVVLGGNAFVLAGLRLARPPQFLPRLFALTRPLRAWSMIEVYLVGVFIAYTRLRGLARTEIGAALYALAALMVIMIAVDVWLDRQAVWEAIESRGLGRALKTAPQWAIGCEICGLASPSGTTYCPRCHSRLHRRKPYSVQRTWALVIAAAILYVPANTYPVLSATKLGRGGPSTIIEGVIELLNHHLWPLALIVFLASIVVPILKLIGLSTLLLTTQLGRTGRLIHRTKLHRVIALVGRWSMIDIFIGAVLVGLVQFGILATVAPGPGAIAFAAVVVLTMLASESFDPRLMWDAAAPQEWRQ
ncbi:MAG: paraquat-inducible protein A [Acetobacteraceae bacterium]|nr:paraquat-inducible protein A [Acetobacteraceae bacterium]MBV8525675.1 paraquat-inducible protein A [Acetobacteraceae bacterium]MBV8592017.1 paraquat-inducible protein A [Acetobacteraceae bacterium]